MGCWRGGSLEGVVGGWGVAGAGWQERSGEGAVALEEGEEGIHVVGQWCEQVEGLAADGVVEVEFGGMEGLSVDDGLVGVEVVAWFVVFWQGGAVGELPEGHGFSAVHCVGDDGVFGDAHMDA